MRKIILASLSPRRKQLLKEIVSDFEIKAKNTEEKADSKIPSQVVMQLASQKAIPVLNDEKEDCIVIGADTIVVHNGEILGKPASKAEAKRMLESLSDAEHIVYTGVCIATKTKTDIFFVRSAVLFYPLSEKQIDDYIATGSPFDKAGAYGIQDSGFVKAIKGSYTNVMGLPVDELKEHLMKFTEENNGKS
jgi:septum formation protein